MAEDSEEKKIVTTSGVASLVIVFIFVKVLQDNLVLSPIDIPLAALCWGSLVVLMFFLRRGTW